MEDLQVKDACLSYFVLTARMHCMDHHQLTTLSTCQMKSLELCKTIQSQLQENPAVMKSKLSSIATFLVYHKVGCTSLDVHFPETYIFILQSPEKHINEALLYMCLQKTGRFLGPPNDCFQTKSMDRDALRLGVR